MSLAASLFYFVTQVMAAMGYGGIFSLMVVALTISIPSEVILPFAGYLVFNGTFNFWLVLIVASLGSILGTIIDYTIGYYLGRSVILRYGRFLHLNEKSLTESENWFKKYGEEAVLLTRFVPLIRTLIAFPAGIGEMKISKFLIYSTAGMTIWNAVLIYIGYRVGPSVKTIINSLSSTFTVVEVVSVVVAALALFFWMRGSRKSAKEMENEEPSSASST